MIARRDARGVFDHPEHRALLHRGADDLFCAVVSSLLSAGSAVDHMLKNVQPGAG